MATTQQRWETALRRVIEQHVRPIALGYGGYLVASATVPGRGYFTRLYPDGHIRCTCPAGFYRQPCKHAAAVWWLERDFQEGVLGNASR